jgi:hypothetical protein
LSRFEPEKREEFTSFTGGDRELFSLTVTVHGDESEAVYESTAWVFVTPATLTASEEDEPDGPMAMAAPGPRFHIAGRRAANCWTSPSSGTSRCQTLALLWIPQNELLASPNSKALDVLNVPVTVADCATVRGRLAPIPALV